MNIGLSEISRKAVVKELTRILADEFVLYSKTRSAHWNVVGKQTLKMKSFHPITVAVSLLVY